MDIEKLEAAAAAQGTTVKSLKTSGAGKEEVEAAVAGLVAAKKALADAITAALAALPEGAPEAEALKAKLPPPPKPSNKDKKAAKDGDAAKEAARKAAEEQKLAARAKKKEAAAAKGVKEGGGKGGPAGKGADGAKPDGAASKAPAAKPNGSGAAAAAPVHAKPMSNKNYELHFGAAAPPLLAVVAARLVRQEVALRRVDPKALPSGCDSVLYLPGGSRSLRGCGAIARYFARLAPPELGAYGAAGDALSASEVDEWIEWLSASGPPAAATPPLLARLARHLRMRPPPRLAAASGCDLRLLTALRCGQALLRDGPRRLPRGRRRLAAPAPAACARQGLLRRGSARRPLVGLRRGAPRPPSWARLRGAPLHGRVAVWSGPARLQGGRAAPLRRRKGRRLSRDPAAERGAGKGGDSLRAGAVGRHPPPARPGLRLDTSATRPRHRVRRPPPHRPCQGGDAVGSLCDAV